MCRETVRRLDVVVQLTQETKRDFKQDWLERDLHIAHATTRITPPGAGET
jgi:ornithine cyclodeaminase/alanine dehydrogenase-like protein (mu-crystallin family)